MTEFKRSQSKKLKKIVFSSLAVTILSGAILPNTYFLTNPLVSASEIDATSTEDGALVELNVLNNVASEGVIFKDITDTNDARVVEAVYNDEKIISTLDKENNVLTIQVGSEEPIVIDMNQATQEYINSKSSDDVYIPTFRATIKENTFSNYEYTITTGSPEKWKIRRPKGDSIVSFYEKSVTYTSATKSNLNSFKAEVNKINTLEFKVFGSALTATGLTYLSLMLSIPTAGAGTVSTGLAALGAAGTTLNYCLSLHTAMQNAALYYSRA